MSEEEGRARPGRWRRWWRRQRWWIMNLYPPYLGAGIRVRASGEEGEIFDAWMKLTPLNRNYVGTHFGGSLYSLCDPFYMLILKQQLGRGYVVWDKAATIQFRRPGRSRVHAHFEIPPEQVEEIRRQAETQRKVEPVFRVEVRDEAGELVAEVEKVLYVRRERPATEQPVAEKTPVGKTAEPA